MEQKDAINYIIIVSVIIVIFVIINRSIYPCQNNLERFRAHGLDNPDIDLLDNTIDDTFTPHTHHHNVNYLSNQEFIHMVEHIKDICKGSIINFAKGCQSMNGDDQVGTGKYPMTLFCQTDAWSMEEKIVLRITEFIRSHIKRRFGISINHYKLIHDLMRHLNLLEAVLYPLQYSGLYTVHGIQYTNAKLIKQQVDTNLDVKDVLYTTLTSRNISLLLDTDQHIQ